jgi:hypothetical protein
VLSVEGFKQGARVAEKLGKVTIIDRDKAILIVGQMGPQVAQRRSR